MAVHDARSRGEWLMVVVLSVIGVALIALGPRKQSAEDALLSQLSPSERSTR